MREAVGGEIRLFRVDAFTERPFSGNPAAVVIERFEASRDWMQAVATEIAAPATAFVATAGEPFGLRWFTSTSELEFCGHGTLAAAHVLYESGHVTMDSEITFSSLAGTLRATSRDGGIEMRFPAMTPEPLAPPAELLEALGLTSEDVVGAVQNRERRVLVLRSEAEVSAIVPNFPHLALAGGWVAVTAAADDADTDFVSRYFPTSHGLLEDHATGSIHCLLGPYWAQRLNRQTLSARQLSARRGAMTVIVHGDQVYLRARAVTIAEGRLSSKVASLQTPT